MTEKRFKVAIYDDKAINGFAVLDLQKPNSSKRLEYENVYIGSKAGCEIVCNFGNSLADENEQLKSRVEYLERKIDRERTSYQKQHEKWEEEIKKEINQELSNIISAIEKGSCRSRWFS